MESCIVLSGISHHLSPTAATIMNRNGVSLRAIQMIGGWSTPRMVERYADVDDAELARAVRVTRNHGEAACKADHKRDHSGENGDQER